MMPGETSSESTAGPSLKLRYSASASWSIFSFIGPPPSVEVNRHDSRWNRSDIHYYAERPVSELPDASKTMLQVFIDRVFFDPFRRGQSFLYPLLGDPPFFNRVACVF